LLRRGQPPSVSAHRANIGVAIAVIAEVATHRCHRHARATARRPPWTPGDPAFMLPTKPIGPMYTQDEAQRLAA